LLLAGGLRSLVEAQQLEELLPPGEFGWWRRSASGTDSPALLALAVSAASAAIAAGAEFAGLVWLVLGLLGAVLLVAFTPPVAAAALLISLLAGVSLV
jgi:hypothetical protein